MLKLVATALALACAPNLLAADLTLEQAMSDPDWIGPPVEQAFWSADSKAAYYRVKRAGSPLRLEVSSYNHDGLAPNYQAYYQQQYGNR